MPALLLAACGTSNTTTPDSGATSDAGATPDAGTPTDGGTPPDAGSPSDGGDPTTDAGTTDAGPIVDQAFGGALSYEVQVPAGSFEPSNTEQNGRPLNFGFAATFPADSMARLEKYVNAGFEGPAGLGEHGFHFKSSHVFQSGETDANRIEVQTSGFLGNVAPGVTYEFSAWMRNPGSANWAGVGPDLGFIVGEDRRRTGISLGTLPVGEWKRATVTYTGTAGDAGKSLGVLVGIYGNSPGAEQLSPELWVDGLVVKVTTAQSIALDNPDFAAPAVTGDTTTLPTGWTLMSRTNEGDVVGLVRPPGGDISEDLGGRQFLHFDNAYVIQSGETDVRTVVESGVVAKAVPGKRYFFFARFRDYGSMQWAGNGPKLSVKVGSQASGFETSIIGIKGWGHDDMGAVFVTGPFNESQAGAQVRLQLEVWGHLGGVGGHPETYVSGLALGAQ